VRNNNCGFESAKGFGGAGSANNGKLEEQAQALGSLFLIAMAKNISILQA
jgi:hypothetical protein